MQLNAVPQMCLLLTNLLLLTACEKVVFRSQCPPLVDYAQATQTKAADELEAETRPPCHPQDASSSCSATLTFILDYKTLRDKCRALEAGD
jgi:hypothetical protein